MQFWSDLSFKEKMRNETRHYLNHNAYLHNLWCFYLISFESYILNHLLIRVKVHYAPQIEVTCIINPFVKKNYNELTSHLWLYLFLKIYFINLNINYIFKLKNPLNIEIFERIKYIYDKIIFIIGLF
jgi:hypothetical protein